MGPTGSAEVLPWWLKKLTVCGLLFSPEQSDIPFPWREKKLRNTFNKSPCLKFLLASTVPPPQVNPCWVTPSLLSSTLLLFGEHLSACSSFYPAFVFLPRKLPPLCIYIPARWSLSWGPLWLIHHFNYRDFCKQGQNILGEFNGNLKRSMQVVMHRTNIWWPSLAAWKIWPPQNKNFELRNISEASDYFVSLCLSYWLAISLIYWVPMCINPCVGTISIQKWMNR